MAVTYDSIERTGSVVTIRVTSSLSDPYYHWYIEGAWVGMTRVGEISVSLRDGEQDFVVCQDTTDPDYDAVASAPAGYPARRTLAWIASTDADVAHYRVEESKNGGGWAELGTVRDDGSWMYTYVTGRLDDLATYQWRVWPVDRAGNDGSPVELESENIVRRPDAPAYAVSFSPGALTVTVSSA